MTSGASRIPHTLEELLLTHKKAVDNYVLGILPRQHPVDEIRLLYEMMRDYPSRPSKGLRSSLCMITCEAFGGDPTNALNTAAALELFHNWILIHDDVEDGSQIRRGQPVLHAKHGIPLAINAGDALHGRTWSALLSNNGLLGPERTFLLAKEFLKMTEETTEGQHLELHWIATNSWDLDERDYHLLVEKKTSWYTCISPCRMGGIIANAENEILEALVPFGLDLGLSFQIRDDLLNLVGDEKKYGKEGAGDIAEGKRTLMLLRLLNICTPDDRSAILNTLGRSRAEKTSDQIEMILDLMHRYGVIKYAEKKASEYSSRALKTFEHIFDGAPNREAVSNLRSLIGFMVEREW